MIQKPAYVLAIDEDGFPMLSGLRIDDEEFNREIFTKLRRIDASIPAAALVSESGGKPVLIDAFSAPLMAQSVENIDKDGADWIFPAGVRHRVEHAKLRVDAFHRVHAAIGDQKIPAMLARKAHSPLLMHPSAPTEIRDFYEVEAPVSKSDFWQGAYEQPTQGWELSAPSPVLLSQLDRMAEVRKSLGATTQNLLVPGAGRGHDAEALAAVYSSVTAFDFAPSADSEHRKRYPQSKVTYRIADIFAEFQTTSAGFDGVFEHTMLCAIDPGRRQEYLEGVHRSLGAGSLYFGVFWMRLHPIGPPFGMDPWELRERTKGLFDIFAWELSTASVDSRYGQELWAIFRKKTP